MSPWDILEIKPTADRNAIRKAYADRLKVIRPDEDAAGFQTLREARDAALWFAHQQEIDQQPPPTDHTTHPSSTSGSETNANDAHLTQAGFGTPDETSFHDMSLAHGTAEAAASVRARLATLQSPWTDIWDYAAWWDLLNDMSLAPLQETAPLRREIIGAIGDESNLRPLSNDMPEHRWRRDEVLLLLADDFGWRHDDRELYDLLDWQRANRITTIVRNAEQRLAQRHNKLSTNSGAHRTARPSSIRSNPSDSAAEQSEKGTDKIPEVSENDLESFFATHDGADKIIAYYKKAKQDSDWHLHYHSPAIWKSFFWTASYGLWWRSICLAFYLATAITLYVLLQYHFETVVSWLMPSRGATGTSISLVAAWIVCGVMFLAAILEPPLSAREWLIQRAASKAKEADKLGLTGELERHDFLEDAGRQRTGFITAYYVVFCLALLYIFDWLDAPIAYVQSLWT